MANGFPEGTFRIINKATGACLASEYGGQTSGLQAAVTARGETGVLPYSHTNDRLFTVHGKVENTKEELWYFDSHADSYGSPVNLLYNEVRDIRARWVLGSSLGMQPSGYKLFDKDIETFIGLLPDQDEQTLSYLRHGDHLGVIYFLESFSHLRDERKTSGNREYTETMLDSDFSQALVYNAWRENRHQLAGALHHVFPDDQKEAENAYKIIIAARKLDMLRQPEFRLELDSGSVAAVLEICKKNEDDIRRDTLSIRNVADRRQEALKIVEDLTTTLPPSEETELTKTARKIVQSTLKTDDAYKQLTAALNSTNGKEIETLPPNQGTLRLQGSGQPYLTKWVFEEGFISIQGNPNAVVTLFGDTYIHIAPRSSHSGQQWECKKS